VEKPIESFRDTDSPLVRLVLITNTLAALGALCGILVLVRSQSIYAFPLAAGPIVYPVIYYVTHTSLRYRHPIDPVLLLLVAIALAAALPSRCVHAEPDPLPS
jgi:ABC-type Fe3+-siderophore transport system permease subunit